MGDTALVGMTLKDWFELSLLVFFTIANIVRWIQTRPSKVTVGLSLRDLKVERDADHKRNKDDREKVNVEIGKITVTVARLEERIEGLEKRADRLEQRLDAKTSRSGA